MTRANRAGGNPDTRTKLHVDVRAASRAMASLPTQEAAKCKICALWCQPPWVPTRCSCIASKSCCKLMLLHDEHVLTVAVGAMFARALQHEVREWRGGEHKRH